MTLVMNPLVGRVSLDPSKPWPAACARVPVRPRNRPCSELLDLRRPSEPPSPEEELADGSLAVSKHAVVVRRIPGNDLQHVPVLHDPAVAVEPEDVDARVVVVARPVLVAVQDH